MSKEKLPTLPEVDLDYEIQLLYAMEGFKPVGLSKHFQMTCIVDKLQNSLLEKPISSKQIWEQLQKWYNLEQLDENEPTIKIEDSDFSLPESEYGSLKQKKIPPKALMNPTVPIVATNLEKIAPNTPKNKDLPAKKAETPKEIPKIIESKKDKDALSEKSSKSTSSSSSSSTIHRRDSHKETPVSKKENVKKELPTTPVSTKKAVDKRTLKGRPSRSMTPTSKEEGRKMREREDHSSNKRTTRGSLKPDDASSDHSKSPLTIPSSSSNAKRRRI